MSWLGKKPAVATLLAGGFLAGCGEPAGTRAERGASDAAGSAYVKPRAERDLPPLGEPLTVDALLARAFLANASLEAAYYRWRAALERVPQASALMNPDVSFEYLTSSGQMRAWDRTTLGVQQRIPTAGKRGLAADAALAGAISARHAFEAEKFDLQMKVFSGAADYRFLAASIEAARENLRFLGDLVALAETRQKVGKGRQQDYLKALVERDAAENEMRVLEARRPVQAALLNALLGRGPAEPLSVPQEEPSGGIPVSDEAVLCLAAARNPELAGLAAEVRGRRDALSYARRLWIPDVTLGIEIMGDIESSVMGMLALPVQWPALRAAVREAEANLSEAEAKRLSASDNLGARVVAALAEARDAERQIALFEGAILPVAEQTLSVSIAGYRTGGEAAGDFLTVIDSQRTLLALRLAAAAARAARARATADLERILAVDRSCWGDGSAQTGEDGHERD